MKTGEQHKETLTNSNLLIQIPPTAATGAEVLTAATATAVCEDDTCLGAEPAFAIPLFIARMTSSLLISPPLDVPREVEIGSKN